MSKVLEELKLEVAAGMGPNTGWLVEALANPAIDIYSECYWRQAGQNTLGTVHYRLNDAVEAADGTIHLRGSAEFTPKDREGHDYPERTIAGVIAPTTAFWPGSERTDRGDIIYHGVVVLQAYVPSAV